MRNRLNLCRGCLHFIYVSERICSLCGRDPRVASERYLSRDYGMQKSSLLLRHFIDAAVAQDSTRTSGDNAKQT